MHPRLGVPLTALFLGVLSASGRETAAGQTAPPAIAIVSPKEGASVAQTDQIEGKLRIDGWPVVAVRPEDGEWWFQPRVEEVSDGSFTGQVYFGGEETRAGTRFSVVILAARDKEAAGRFPSGARWKSLPDNLPRSAIVTVTRGGGAGEPGGSPGVPRTIAFAGHTWNVKSGGRKMGPGPNLFSDSPENVWLDDEHYLHLAVTQRRGTWRCAEVVAHQSLGYGEYRWVISGDLAALDPRVVLGLFLYEDDSNEIDFELSRWGQKTGANAQFVVQPPAKDRMTRFDTGSARVLTCSLVWEERLVRGRCWAGDDITGAPLVDWTFTGRRMPRPGRERARANLWLFQGSAPAKEQEIVIRSFHFDPAGPEKGHERPH